MHFDVFTFFAQIFNFLLLLFLMKRFLYGPILRMMEIRENTIAKKLQEANAIKMQADKEREIFSEKNAQFELNREIARKSMQNDIEGERQRLWEEVKNGVDALKQDWLASLSREKRHFFEEVRRGIGKQVYAISQQVLHKLAGVGIESQIVGTFLNKVRQLSQDDSRIIREALLTQGERIDIRSSFNLSQSFKDQISSEMRSIFGENIRLDFQTEKKTLGAGIELVAGTYKLTWSTDEFMATIDDNFEDLMSRAPIVLDEMRESGSHAKDTLTH